MPDDERLAALKKVRAARNAAGDVLEDSNLSAADRATAQKAWDDLDDLEGDLILSDLEEQLDALKTSAGDLDVLVGQMKTASASLQQLAGTISAASSAVGTLAQVVGAAAASGVV